MDEKQKLCLSCMECCKTIAIPFDYFKLSDEDFKFYKLRGAKFVTIEQGPFMILDLPCPHLTSEGCSIYKERLRICREYDGRKVPFMKDKCKWYELE